MKNFTKSVLLCAAVLLALPACESVDKKQNKQVVQANANMSADELADAGEQLVTPYTFMLADKVFDQALEKNPNNLKAQFYKKFLKRFMIFEGIANRVGDHYAKTNGKPIEKEVNGLPNSAIKSFVFNSKSEGKAKINSITDTQNFVTEYENALEDLYSFLRKNTESELTLNLNPYLFEKEINEEYAKSCVVVVQTENETKVECDASGVATKKMNSADMVMLRQIVGYERLAWALYNSYSLEGYDDLSKVSEERELSSEEQWKLVASKDSLLKLRSNAKIRSIPGLLQDGIAGARWTLQYQDRLCPADLTKRDKFRKGYLFQGALCIDGKEAFIKGLEEGEKAISGVTKQEIVASNGEVKLINVDAMAWFRNPVSDLKKIIVPVNDRFECGTRFQYADKTMGGLLPDGDVDQIATTIECEK